MLGVRHRGMTNMKHKLMIIASMLSLFVPSVHAQSLQKNVSSSGTVRGVIERTESDVNGLHSVFFKVKGRMHEFLIRDAKFINGTPQDLQQGKRIEVKFNKREHSEMDDFFTAHATVVNFKIRKKRIRD